MTQTKQGAPTIPAPSSEDDMPVYTFWCPVCDTQYEVLVSIHDEKKKSLCRYCPDGTVMHKIPSLPSPPFGGGTPKFYTRG